jgi:hypothetical protein
MAGKIGGTMLLRRCALRTREIHQRFRFWPILLGSFAVIASGCILSDDRCDANEVHATPGKLDYCACAPGSIPDPKGYGCLKCGAHEAVKDGKCTCKDGFVKDSPTASCHESVGQPIGAACSDESTCTDPYPYCASDGPNKYCTSQDCTGTDCPSGYTCETRTDSKFCAKLPSGIDAPCATNADCSAFAASECNPFSMKCLLGSCATGKTHCPNGWSCCDVGMFMPGISYCAAPDDPMMCFGQIVMP